MIYIISYDDLPNGDAGAVRNMSIAKIFRAHGYNVTLIGMGFTKIYQFSEFEGLPYVSLRIKKHDLISRVKNYFGLKKRIQKIIRESNETIEAIMVTQLPINALLFIKKVTEQYNVKLLAECCEWYSPNEFRLGKLDINFIRNMYFIQKYVDSKTFPIAISKYLNEYFTNKGISSTRIPVIMDVKCIDHRKTVDKDKLTLVYAGSPGRKDYLKEITDGLIMLDDNDLMRIEFRIIGITKSELIEYCGVSSISLDKLGTQLKTLGRVSRKQVLHNLEEADFTVLLRSERLRYARAGFPTKVVESLATATPVICNITSDLGDYLSDGENALIVQDCSAASFYTAIRRALLLNSELKEKMYKNARKCAETYFDYRLYKDDLKELLM